MMKHEIKNSERTFENSCTPDQTTRVPGKYRRREASLNTQIIRALDAAINESYYVDSSLTRSAKIRIECKSGHRANKNRKELLS